MTKSNVINIDSNIIKIQEVECKDFVDLLLESYSDKLNKRYADDKVHFVSFDQIHLKFFNDLKKELEFLEFMIENNGLNVKKYFDNLTPDIKIIYFENNYIKFDNCDEYCNSDKYKILNCKSVEALNEIYIENKMFLLNRK